MRIVLAITTSLIGCAIVGPVLADTSPDRAPDCGGYAKPSRQETPVTLYRAASACVAEDRLDEAVALYVQAAAYGKYDTLRVADRPAHEAAGLLRALFAQGLSESARVRFGGALEAALGEPGKRAALCARIRDVGAPAYAPDYMRAHGMGAFLGTEGALPENFDAKAAWQQALAYISCADGAG